MSIVFDNSYARDLPGAYVAWRPTQAPAPQMLFLNRALAEELGFDAAAVDGAAGAALFSGNALPDGAEPLAQAYAGHQFGGFSPQLGDGRALLVGEVVDRHGQRRDIAFKGSGRTPFSRGGDGKAAVGPMLREVLIGEAMHALGIPTTRALAVAGQGGEALPWRLERPVEGGAAQQAPVERWQGLPPTRMLANSPAVQLQMARAGLGVALVSDFFAAPWVRTSGRASARMRSPA